MTAESISSSFATVLQWRKRSEPGAQWNIEPGIMWEQAPATEEALEEAAVVMSFARRHRPDLDWQFALIRL